MPVERAKRDTMVKRSRVKSVKPAPNEHTSKAVATLAGRWSGRVARRLENAWTVPDDGVMIGGWRVGTVRELQSILGSALTQTAARKPAGAKRG